MPRKSVIGTWVCAFTKPGRIAPVVRIVDVPLYFFAMSDALPTATIFPPSMATAPWSMFGPAMVRTVPPVTTTSTCLVAARVLVERRARRSANIPRRTGSVLRSEVERVGEELGQLVVNTLTFEPGQRDLDVAAVLPHQLAAGTTRRPRLLALRDDDDGVELPLARRQRRKERHALRAD